MLDIFSFEYHKDFCYYDKNREVRMSKDIESVKALLSQQIAAYKITDSMGATWIESGARVLKAFLSIGKKGMTPMYAISESEKKNIELLMDELEVLRAQSESKTVSHH